MAYQHIKHHICYARKAALLPTPPSSKLGKKINCIMHKKTIISFKSFFQLYHDKGHMVMSDDDKNTSEKLIWVLMGSMEIALVETSCVLQYTSSSDDKSPAYQSPCPIRPLFSSSHRVVTIFSSPNNPSMLFNWRSISHYLECLIWKILGSGFLLCPFVSCMMGGKHTTQTCCTLFSVIYWIMGNDLSVFLPYLHQQQQKEK